MNKDYELEYLMNPTLYDKYQKLSSKERETAFLQDKQFYRKRIQQMAKECAKYKLVKGATEPPKALMNSFDAFSKQCIVYFKTIDEKCKLDKVFLFEPIPLEEYKDGWPRVNLSYEQSLFINDILYDLITKFGYDPIIVKFDTVENRFNFIKENI